MNAEMCTISYKKQDISTDALKKFFKGLDKHFVTVGIHKAEGALQIGKDNFTMIKNACIQEFGTTYTVEKSRRFKSPYTGKWFYLKAGTEITIPPRVFIRIFTDKRLQKELTKEYEEIMDIDPNIVLYDSFENDNRATYGELDDDSQINCNCKDETTNNNDCICPPKKCKC